MSSMASDRAMLSWRIAQYMRDELARLVAERGITTSEALDEAVTLWIAREQRRRTRKP